MRRSAGASPEDPLRHGVERAAAASRAPSTSSRSCGGGVLNQLRAATPKSPQAVSGHQRDDGDTRGGQRVDDGGAPEAQRLAAAGQEHAMLSRDSRMACIASRWSGGTRKSPRRGGARRRAGDQRQACVLDV
jgi:hypothetical protein